MSKPRPSTPSYLTAAEVASRLGVTRRTITRWADAGRLPSAMKLGGPRGARLFDVRDVEAFEALDGEATAS